MLTSKLLLKNFIQYPPLMFENLLRILDRTVAANPYLLASIALYVTLMALTFFYKEKKYTRTLLLRFTLTSLFITSLIWVINTMKIRESSLFNVSMFCLVFLLPALHFGAYSVLRTDRRQSKTSTEQIIYIVLDYIVLIFSNVIFLDTKNTNIEYHSLVSSISLCCFNILKVCVSFLWIFIRKNKTARKIFKAWRQCMINYGRPDARILEEDSILPIYKKEVDRLKFGNKSGFVKVYDIKDACQLETIEEEDEDFI